MTEEVLGREVGMVNARGKSRAQFQTTDFGPSLTKQSQADQADIQFILKQYPGVKLAQELDRAELRFGDITELPDYADAAIVLREAEEMFLRLPSKTREVFDHDVAKFLDAAHDPDKRDLLVKAGIVDPPEVPPEITVPEPAVPPEITVPDPAPEPTPPTE